jgi:hypothetical protein
VSATEAELRELLAAVRAERDHASHVIALVRLQLDEDSPPPPGLFWLRREIELQVAELRLSRWSETLRQVERDLRALGLRP